MLSCFSHAVLTSWHFRSGHLCGMQCPVSHTWSDPDMCNACPAPTHVLYDNVKHLHAVCSGAYLQITDNLSFVLLTLLDPATMNVLWNSKVSLPTDTSCQCVLLL